MSIYINDIELSSILRSVFPNNDFDVKIELGSSPNYLKVEVTETTRGKNTRDNLNDEPYIYTDTIRKVFNLLDDAKEFLVYRYVRYVATGEDYILTTEKEVAEKNGMQCLHVKGYYIMFPENGHVYDFRDATSPVWVCGKPHTTTVNYESSPIDVQGKKIEITDVCAGDDTKSATIIFIII